jgi:hypothetical protein
MRKSPSIPGAIHFRPSCVLCCGPHRTAGNDTHRSVALSGGIVEGRCAAGDGCNGCVRSAGVARLLHGMLHAVIPSQPQASRHRATSGAARDRTIGPAGRQTMPESEPFGGRCACARLLVCSAGGAARSDTAGVRGLRTGSRHLRGLPRQRRRSSVGSGTEGRFRVAGLGPGCRPAGREGPRRAGWRPGTRWRATCMPRAGDRRTGTHQRPGLRQRIPARSRGPEADPHVQPVAETLPALLPTAGNG